MAVSEELRQDDQAAAPGEGILYCMLPEMAEPMLPGDLDPHRRDAILSTHLRWANGTVLRYYFFNGERDGEAVPRRDGSTVWRSFVGSPADVDVVRNAFSHWKAQSIGLDFEEVNDPRDAELRIGFAQGDGSWSYIGTDNAHRDHRAPDKRTMNFGWPLHGSAYGFDTALHEIGHAIGLPHEHQNPNAGLVWDEAAVLAHFAGPPNGWQEDKVRRNILQKLPAAQVRGSDWDPNSVMHYRFAANLILQPSRYRSTGITPAGGLSADDIAWVRQFYPPLTPAAFPALPPHMSIRLNAHPGEQAHFCLQPVETREHRIRVLGEADCLMVLFEMENGTPRFRVGEDDSGQDGNAEITIRLQRGRTYILRILMRYAPEPHNVSVIAW